MCVCVCLFVSLYVYDVGVLWLNDFNKHFVDWIE